MGWSATVVPIPVLPPTATSFSFSFSFSFSKSVNRGASRTSPLHYGAVACINPRM